MTDLVWQKAIAGIGSGNVKDVPIDNAARMDPKALDKLLAACIEGKEEANCTPVYAVVAIMGSTEQGAVDPLVDILNLRRKYQQKGLSFVVHCDGAWGGYFASMIPSQKDGGENIVPVQALQPYTRDQLKAYSEADTITIDPHKSVFLSLFFVVPISDRSVGLVTFHILLVDSVIVTGVCDTS